MAPRRPRRPRWPAGPRAPRGPTGPVAPVGPRGPAGPATAALLSAIDERCATRVPPGIAAYATPQTAPARRIIATTLFQRTPLDRSTSISSLETCRRCSNPRFAFLQAGREMRRDSQNGRGQTRKIVTTRSSGAGKGELFAGGLDLVGII